MLTFPHTIDDMLEDLQVRGYTVLRTKPDTSTMTFAATWFATHIGAHSIGVKELDGSSSPEWLPRHTEHLKHPEVLDYFALGCLKPSDVGGATCLFDGRAAARRLFMNHPELVEVSITYATEYRPGTGTHPLIIHEDGHGATVRFRSALPTNKLASDLPDGLSEAKIYTLVEEALSDSLILAHQWRPGDLMIVNNRIMVHARQPYVGRRRMLRYRFDDPNFQTAIINR